MPLFEHFGVLMTNKAPFCALLRLTRTVFSWLLKKAFLMALWTKASICDKACPERSRMGSLYKQILPRTPNRPKQNQCNVRNLRLKNSCLCVAKKSAKSAKSASKKSMQSVVRNPCNLRNPWLINDLRLRILTYEKINLFLQNEPKFRKSQINVSTVITTNYEQRTMNYEIKNEPKTNPNEPKTNPNKPNTNPISVFNHVKLRNLQCHPEYEIHYPL